MQLYYALANEPQNTLLNDVSVRLTERGVTQDDVVAVSAILGISADQAARMLREAALVDSDWTQLPDTQLDKAAWATYRQAMRDITDQPGFPDAIIWPEKPESVASAALTITFAQLLIGLVAEAWITQAEGEAWLAGVLPAQVTDLIATLPVEQQFAAKARAARPSEVLRMDPLVVSMGAAQGKTSEELDQFFRTYSGV